MREKQIWVCASVVLMLLGLGFIPPGAEAGKKGEAQIINPGSAGRCASDFVVENMDAEVADLKVVLGDKVYISVLVNPGERLAYSLPGTIALAQFHRPPGTAHGRGGRWNLCRTANVLPPVQTAS